MELLLTTDFGEINCRTVLNTCRVQLEVPTWK
jgi:hypothetical protein